MTYRALRKSDKRKERDRVQWSDVEQVKFDIVAHGVGEAIVGPIYFGYAYDRPGLAFTYAVESPPAKFTAGVKEWIQDANGAYVGAYLWYKIDGCAPADIVFEEAPPE